MPQPLLHVVGLIEIDAPATPADLTPDAGREKAGMSDRFRGQSLAAADTHRCTVQLRAASNAQLRANLQRLCLELDAELLRVRAQLKKIRETTR